MRREVRSVERAEGSLQRAATGKGRRPFVVFRVAREAAARRRKVFAALRVALRVRAPRRKRDEQCDDARLCGASQRTAGGAGLVYCRCRNVSWQPLQALATSPIAVLAAASLPLLAAVTNFVMSANTVSWAALNFAGSE